MNHISTREMTREEEEQQQQANIPDTELGADVDDDDDPVLNNAHGEHIVDEAQPSTDTAVTTPTASPKRQQGKSVLVTTTAAKDMDASLTSAGHRRQFSTTRTPLDASITSTGHRRHPAHHLDHHHHHHHVRPLGASQRSAASSRRRIGSVYRTTTGGAIRTVHSAHPPISSMHRDPATAEENIDATWNDVFRACCVHSFAEWLRIAVFISALLFLLYFFLVGLDLMGTAFQVVGGCTAGSLLGSDTNPIASVMIGIIATALLQSSSTTTAIIVSLVSGGLDVHQAIYMVMGANVGTSVTSMLVSMAHMADGEELERAFAGSSVYFIFNFCTLVILFPLEVTTEYLYHLTKLMLPEEVSDESGDSWEGPIKKMVSPLVKTIIIANKEFIEDVSGGASCSAVYPVNCVDGVVSYESCKDAMGVIACDKKTGRCPAFFQDGATKKDDMVSGWVCMIVALTVLIVCLVGLVALLRKLLMGASTRIIYKATDINPYLAMVIGCGVTVLVQSSSITTSTLVPLAGVGVLNLENMYPLVLGADIGTTVTALMAAMVSSKVEALQVALVHLFFNVTGIVIWYPIPPLRRFVLSFARLLGKATRHWRAFPCVFIVAVFFLLPLLLYGISTCFEKGGKGFTALGVFILVIVVGAVVYFWLWWSCRDGKNKCLACIERRQRRSAAIRVLADDLDYLKVDTEWCRNEIGRLKDFAGLLTMEEGTGRPAAVAVTPEEEEVEELEYTEEDDRVSTYESCRSRPWKDILFMASGSIRSELFGSGAGSFGPPSKPSAPAEE